MRTIVVSNNPELVSKYQPSDNRHVEFQSFSTLAETIQFLHNLEDDAHKDNVADIIIDCDLFPQPSGVLRQKLMKIQHLLSEYERYNFTLEGEIYPETKANFRELLSPEPLQTRSAIF